MNNIFHGFFHFTPGENKTAAEKISALSERGYDALNPKVAAVYSIRAFAHGKKGSGSKAVEDYEQAIRLDPKFASAYNNLAWLLATSPDPSIRNGKRAVELAQHACELSEWKRWNYLGTLAAAYAENGEFEDAVKWQQKSLEAGIRESEAEKAQQRLLLYERQKPFHAEQ